MVKLTNKTKLKFIINKTKSKSLKNQNLLDTQISEEISEGALNAVLFLYSKRGSSSGFKV